MRGLIFLLLWAAVTTATAHELIISATLKLLSPREYYNDSSVEAVIDVVPLGYTYSMHGAFRKLSDSQLIEPFVGTCTEGTSMITCLGTLGGGLERIYIFFPYEGAPYMTIWDNSATSYDYHGLEILSVGTN